ncbi:RHS repeat-associated core domain-containing protein [Pelotomaculum propionicicum]|uniref:tRNA3(Ser)-specific nuclease WapA n=1 Tax=Pelotomaculum propionicicum TaxID=258475 RepID=A0A4Y7RRG7_9FIRM|nr:RHS repeat-associated core domain-containing protein [Pelotomaculum propionicicum]TEB10867.1 tRNA3(Ser)-specific nuclease WapA [Pelotomaculum propionicicum]
MDISPGTIFKVKSGITIFVNGALNANGADINPVVFTSIKDDTYGGDTNNDGTATTPQPGNWNVINLAASSKIDFNYVTIRYGNTAISRIGANPEISVSNCDISNMFLHGIEIQSCTNVNISNNKLVTTTDALGRTTTCGYDAENNLISVTDPLNHTTSYTYDYLNRLTSTTDANGRTETYTLDGNGNRVSKTDRNGNTTTYAYDVLNRLTRVTDAMGNSVATEYDALGNKTSVTDQRGNVTSYTYDQSSRLLSVTDPLGGVTSYTYDLAGNKLSVTDARGACWSYTYDDANRLTTVIDPLGHTSVTVYDSAGNVTERTDANNNTTTFGYDSLNRLSLVTDALGRSTSYTYDSNGNLTAVTNAKNQTFTAAYDALNRVVQESDPLGNTSLKTYDYAGNLSSKTRPDGSTINYTYDAVNRLTNISYPDQSSVSYAYDYNGNRTSMTDPAGSASYNYDSLNRLTSVTRSVYSVGYEYDQAGNMTALVYPGGLRVSYTYNGLNLPSSVSDSVYSTSISYDEAGNRTQEILPNGVTVTYEYDLSGRLILLQHAIGGNIIARSAYTLDNVGNRMSVTDEQGGITSYVYDNLYQLTRVTYPDSQVVDYTYDQVGNRTSAGGVPYTYDNANRLIQVGITPYAYDAGGNLTSVGGTTLYNYDYENRLTYFTDGTKTIQYSYDGDGNRLSQSVSGSVYEYIYDINTGIPRLLVENDGQGGVNNYLYAGRLFSRIGNEDRVYYHQDGLGSISAITDIAANLLNRYTYDVFGLPRSVSESVNNSFRFAGEQYDSNDLIYLRARYYNPATGRFLSQDTFQGKLNDPLSQNRYAYCGNNPVLFVDPTGNVTICELPWSNMGYEELYELYKTLQDQIENEQVILNGDYEWWQKEIAEFRLQEFQKNYRVINELLIIKGDYSQEEKDFASLTLDNIDKEEFEKSSQIVLGLYGGKGSKLVKGTGKAAGSINLSIKPVANNPKLQNVINELYRPGATVGNGSTMDAIRYELQTGQMVGGKSHILKGQERVRNLENIIRKQNLDPEDQAIANALLQDLKNALSGN